MARILVISGPSGVGKSTLETKLAHDGHFKKMVSVTTRERRNYEVDGVHYYFWTEEQYQEAIDNGEFVEYIEKYGNRYGITKTEIDRHLTEGDDAIIAINHDGLAQLRKLGIPTFSAFILPPRLSELTRRLKDRGQEDDDEMSERLKAATAEIEFSDDYDVVVVNEEVGVACDEIMKAFKESEDEREKEE